MKKLFKRKRTTLITYAVSVVIISCLTLFLLFVNCYEASMVIGVSSFFNFFYLLLILYYGTNPEQQNLAKGGKVFVFTLIRTLIEIFSLGIATLLLYFTKNEAFDTKYRMLFILTSLVPYFMAILYFDIHSKIGEDNDSSKNSK